MLFFSTELVYRDLRQKSKLIASFKWVCDVNVYKQMNTQLELLIGALLHSLRKVINSYGQILIKNLTN